MMRELLEIVMLLGLVGGLFFIKHELAKDAQERRNAGKPDSSESND